LQTFLNDNKQPVQSASINRWYFARFSVSYISGVMTLLPGRVLTGTPQGVGPMQVGDRVRIEIEGIGQMENTVVVRPTPTAP
jgi:2-keto-4-pentenoate hydratase/2-oxohepta-3-ene-1,7-dioic acid hydratase in catechol pathway